MNKNRKTSILDSFCFSLFVFFTVFAISMVEFGISEILLISCLSLGTGSIIFFSLMYFFSIRYKCDFCSKDWSLNFKGRKLKNSIVLDEFECSNCMKFIYRKCKK